MRERFRRVDSPQLSVVDLDEALAAAAKTGTPRTREELLARPEVRRGGAPYGEYTVCFPEVERVRGFHEGVSRAVAEEVWSALDAGEVDGRFFLITGGAIENSGAKLRSMIELPNNDSATAPVGLPESL